MLLLDVDVGNSALARDLLKSILEGRAVGCKALETVILIQWLRTAKLTNFVKLEELVLGVKLIQSLLGLLAVRAVRLGEDNCEGFISRGPTRGAKHGDKRTNRVVVDELLNLGGCLSHCAWACCASEE